MAYRQDAIERSLAKVPCGQKPDGPPLNGILLRKDNRCRNARGTAGLCPSTSSDINTLSDTAFKGTRPQVALRHNRNALEVLHALNSAARDAGLVEPFPVKRHLCIGMLHHFTDKLILQGLHSFRTPGAAAGVPPYQDDFLYHSFPLPRGDNQRSQPSGSSRRMQGTFIRCSISSHNMPYSGSLASGPLKATFIVDHAISFLR